MPHLGTKESRPFFWGSKKAPNFQITSINEAKKASTIVNFCSYIIYKSVDKIERNYLRLIDNYIAYVNQKRLL